MSENPFGDLFGDPDELRRRMEELGEQMQGAQKVAWADNAIKLAVDMTVAGLGRLNLQGNAEQQAEELRTAMTRLFPEAVALVREAREGFGGLFGDPEELQRRMAEFAEQMQGAQKVAWADSAIRLAADMTVAAINRINLQGDAEAQAAQVRSVMAIVFPEAVTLVREARQGLQ